MNKKSLLKTKIILMLVLLLLAILIPRIPSKTGVDKRLKPYLDEVVILSKGNLDYKGLHINFDNLNKETIGVCYYNRKEILIDLNYFKRANEKGKILLLAHEIAHCKKKIEHINGVNGWGCGKHFMHSYDGGNWCNEYMFKEYTKQMESI